MSLSPSNPSGTITLTAQNGPVTWSVAQTGGGPPLAIFPSSGSLAAGNSVTVNVIVQSASYRFTTELLVSPGGQTVTVSYGRHGG